MVGARVVWPVAPRRSGCPQRVDMCDHQHSVLAMVSIRNTVMVYRLEGPEALRCSEVRQITGLACYQVERLVDVGILR